MGKITRTLRWDSPTDDGFASCTVLEERDSSDEPVRIAVVQHHHTKKALQLARLFLRLCPKADLFEMALMRETPLSKAIKVLGVHSLSEACRVVGPKEKDARFRIATFGDNSLEIDMWASVALATSDAFQERAIRRKR